MRLIFAPIVGIIAFCLVAPTFAQDSGSSLTQSQTEAAQSQSASQVASSGDSSSSGASQTNSASESNSASSGSSSPTSTAQPVTSVYSTVFETFSLSGTQNATISYTTTANITTVIAASSTSARVTLPTADTTAAAGNAGGDATVTAPDPGNTSFRNAGPDDSYTTGFGTQLRPIASILSIGLGSVVAGMLLV